MTTERCIGNGKMDYLLYEYEVYKAHGLQELCPIDPGPERDAWNTKRMYFACKRFVDAVENSEDPCDLEKAAYSVCIATRDPGWAPYQEVFSQLMGSALNEANETHGVLESRVTKWEVSLTFHWGNENVVVTQHASLGFARRLHCTCGEDDGGPGLSLAHKTWCPKAGE